MEKYLSSIQALEFCDICNAYSHGEYNTLINSVRSSGYIIKKFSDKKAINGIMSRIIEDKDISMGEAIELAVENKLIRLSDSCVNKVKYEKDFVEQNNNEP